MSKMSNQKGKLHIVNNPHIVDKPHWVDNPHIVDKPHWVDKPHMAKTSFSIEAYKQITIFSCNKYSEVISLLSVAHGRVTKAHSKNNPIF